VWYPVLQVNPLRSRKKPRVSSWQPLVRAPGVTEDAVFCTTSIALRSGRSQSIVALENVNGTSLKGTPLPDESDYRITDVEVGEPSRGYSRAQRGRRRAKY